MTFDCEKPIYGPLGTCVGHCDRHPDHIGPCAVNGVTEEEMLRRLNARFECKPDEVVSSQSSEGA